MFAGRRLRALTSDLIRTQYALFSLCRLNFDLCHPTWTSIHIIYSSRQACVDQSLHLQQFFMTSLQGLQRHVHL